MFDSALQQNMQQWLETALGQYVLEQEQRYFDRVVADIFGYNAAQIGFAGFDFLRNNRMPFKFVLGVEKGASASAYPAFLPIRSNSLDLVLLPHTLEFNSYPLQIFHEVQRVLIDEGRVIISGFNPFSLWGIRWRMTKSGMDFPWRGRFIDLSRVKDWLELLDFEIVAGQFGCYVPPFTGEKWLSRLRFMEAAGDRWWPVAGGVYFLQAVKHECGMHIIRPRWENPSVSKRRAAVVPQIGLGGER
ncbi:Methyltransferase domain-containing protein [Nitrosomonas eutropha]|uniref:class I SAM-dependent methyltransferase n=1 Tax=Nitrosomonas TaxID=914 RepID=UPI00089B098D|nr:MULTISPECIES: methyltransferase domain-containing protein [Nitrosomonas]SDW55760.1 Methyltransferase domain-containing protein [Nitrosomonas eutropha]